MNSRYTALAVLMSRVMGACTVVMGILLIVLTNVFWAPLANGFSKFAEGLSAAHEAVEAVSSGVGSSSSVISRTRQSIVTTSEVVNDTGEILTETGTITDELREMALLATEDLEILGTGLGTIVDQNNFHQMAERVLAVYEVSGHGMQQMEQLTETMETLENDLIEIAVAVESLETDLFSTEAAFGEASDRLEEAARATDSAITSGLILYLVDGAGVLVILVGLYLMILGQALKRIQ